jgi:uncharacterized protein (DUF1499 family)
MKTIAAASDAVAIKRNTKSNSRGAKTTIPFANLKKSNFSDTTKTNTTKTNTIEETTTSTSLTNTTRRSLMFQSISTPMMLASLLQIGAKSEPPQTLGVQEFNGIKSLSLCPQGAQNCLSTSEEMGQANCYAPPWTFNPPESIRVLKNENVYDVALAKKQLLDVLNETDCDGFELNVVQEYDDYIRCTYTSPTFGFIDDVEFWFPRDKRSTVEYRSSSRIGKDDGGKNRSRIRTLRLALQQKYDWASVGF